MQDTNNPTHPNQNHSPQDAIPAPQRRSTSKFINNTPPEIALKDKFSAVLKGTQGLNLDFLVGYFRISGFKHLYEILKPHLQENLHVFGHIRILVGINLDSYSQQLMVKKAEIADADKNRLLKIFKSQQIEHIDADGYKCILNADASVETDYQALEILKVLLSDGILQMRVVKDGDVHAKFYIFSKYTSEDKSYRGSLFVGSSNLTDRGWVKQYEFNAELRDSADIETALYEFNELWEKSVEITSEHIEEIKARSHLTHRTPEEIYYKLLIEYFGMETISTTDPQIAHLFPEGYDALEYQVDAIRDGVNMLERFGGFFLSDVVGLGKTLTISVLLKYLEMTDKLRGNILIACPPAIEPIWETHLGLVKLARHRIVESHHQLDKLYDKADSFDIIVVDESHNFRNTTNKHHEHIKNLLAKGGKKRVILVSATPQNNSIQDLAHQIYFFQNPKNSDLPHCKDLESFFSKKEKSNNEIKNKLKEYYKDSQKYQAQIQEQKRLLKEDAKEVRYKVLDHIMIRRTRTDILKRYAKDAPKFPESNAKTLKYDFSQELLALSEKTLEILMLKQGAQSGAGVTYGYNRYLVYPNLTLEGKDAYQERMQALGEESDSKAKSAPKNSDFYQRSAEQLTTLMKSLLYKRFESSIQAFRDTLAKQLETTGTLIKMFENQESAIVVPIKGYSNLNAYYDALECGTLYNDFLDKNAQNMMQIDKEHFCDDYVGRLRQDYRVLEDLLQEWETITQDPKFDKLIETIKQLREHKGDAGKVVIFTEAKSTANYLKERLAPHFGDMVLQVDSTNRESLQDIISANFDPKCEESKKKDDYHILITTDTLSEGVNMHRACHLIHYDAPWNATQMMQRAGRINRIGGEHKQIFTYSFHPAKDIDDILKLCAQVFVKLQSFHYTLGEDSQVFDSGEEVTASGISSKCEETQEEPEENPRLLYLDDIRTLAKDDPAKFKRIAKIPLKSRSNIIGDTTETYAFFKQKRNKKHGGGVYEDSHFYRIPLQGDAPVESITFEDIAAFMRKQAFGSIGSAEVLQARPSIECKDYRAHENAIQRALEKHGDETNLDPTWKVLEIDANSPRTKANLEHTNAKNVINHLALSATEHDVLKCALDEYRLTPVEVEAVLGARLAECKAIAQKYHEIFAQEKLEEGLEEKLKYRPPTIQLSLTTNLTKDQESNQGPSNQAVNNQGANNEQ